MVQFDTDQTGTLDFKEFVTMVLYSKEFKFQLSGEEREEARQFVGIDVL